MQIEHSLQHHFWHGCGHRLPGRRPHHQLSCKRQVAVASRRATDELRTIREARGKQLAVTDLLAKFTNATERPSMTDIAVQNYDSLTEEFFLTTSTYLEMAKKEGNAEIAAKLEGTLRVAMAELQKHLRPEIRLLNELMQIRDDGERLKLLQASKEVVEMNDGYFLELANNLLQDLKRQPKNAGNALAIHQLHQIQQGARS